MLIDVVTAGNEATHFGQVESCRRVEVNEDFEVDVLVSQVANLAAWESQFLYNPSLLTITGRQVDLFLAVNPGSDVFDVSDDVPDSDGNYYLAAADVADPPQPVTGSGVLARLTLHATNQGLSHLDLDTLLLEDANGGYIGDGDGDDLYDGPNHGAQVAIGQDCPALSAGL